MSAIEAQVHKWIKGRETYQAPAVPEPRDYVAIATRYCEDVVLGQIPACEHVKNACRRQLADLTRAANTDWLYWFNRDQANRVCRFIELFPHIKGPLAGTLIKLEAWQCFIVTTLFGWLNKRTSKRRYRRSYVEVPRGNGKSSFTSPIGLYMLAGDGESGPECYSFATTRDQAKIVFGDAQVMARKTPGYRARFGIEVFAQGIINNYDAGTFKALSAEGHTLDGLNTHFACIDELHAHRTRAVYDVVETSTGKRDQSLLWVITTAGSDRTGICYEVRGHVIKVLQGVIEDDTQFGVVYGIDEGDDWTTEAALIKANPNWGVSVQPDVVLALQAKAISTPSAVNNFLTKHLNVWVNSEVAWINPRDWDECSDPSLDRKDFIGNQCYVSLDLASKLDIASKILIFPPDDPDGVWTIFGDHYLPSDAVENSNNSQYSGWARMGRLRVTDGDVTDYGLIEADVIQDCSTYHAKEVVYDPFQATQLSTRLQDEGVPMVEVRPTVLNYSEPMKFVEALIRQRKIRHDGCPVMSWMMSNVVCHTDAKDNVYPRKERFENKIDGPVALIGGMSRAMNGAFSGAGGILVLE